MKSIISLAILALVASTGVLAAPNCQRSGYNSRKIKNAAKFLARFGYLDFDPDEVATRNLECEISEGIRLMQDFAGIPQTGQLNRKTLKTMSKPRCGHPDMNRTPEHERKKRYVLTRGERWERGTSLNTQIQNLTGDMDLAVQEGIVQAQLDAWNAAASVNFVYRPYGESVSDLQVRIYHSLYDYNGRLWGPRDTTLAYAYFPTVGRMYFNENWNWGPEHINSGDGDTINYNLVLLHELGHIIGIDHSKVNSRKESAVMQPYYNENLDGLQEDDIEAARALFDDPCRGRKC